MHVTNVQWLLLLSQLPPGHDALRVRVWRRLQAIGAVPIRNACWCLPNQAQAVEDFRWCIEEITAAGGEALVCRSSLVDGMSNEHVIDLFRAARDADYAALASEARSAIDELGSNPSGGIVRLASKLRRNLECIIAIDYGSAAGRRDAELGISRLESAIALRAPPADDFSDLPKPGTCLGRTWVTRRDVGIDRLASAWLILRHIDPRARFRFVASSSASKRSGELHFDMFEGDFSHRGEHCTFETLLAWSGIQDAALAKIASVVHDLDLKDGRYQRPENAGVESTIAGIAARFAADTPRIAAAVDFFDYLYAGMVSSSGLAPKRPRPKAKRRHRSPR